MGLVENRNTHIHSARTHRATFRHRVKQRNARNAPGEWAMVHMGNECSVANGTCPEHPPVLGDPLHWPEATHRPWNRLYGVVSEFVACERKIIVDRLSHQFFFFFFHPFPRIRCPNPSSFTDSIAIHLNWIQMTSVFFFFFFSCFVLYYSMIYICIVWYFSFFSRFVWSSNACWYGRATGISIFKRRNTMENWNVVERAHEILMNSRGNEYCK